MLKRTITGAVITAVTVGFLFLRLIDTRLFDILIYFMAIVSTYEVTRSVKDKITKSQRIIAFAFVILAFPVVVFFKQFFIALILAVFIIMIFVSIFDEEKDVFDKIPYTIFCMVYPTVPLICLSVINDTFGDFSLFILIIVLTIASFTDVFAYLVGSKLKGAKLCPKISPNKTISGAVGGLIGGVIASILTYLFVKGVSVNPFVIFDSKVLVIVFLILSGMVLSLVNQVGDLVESYLKRKMGIKDMGTIFPGHGGMMDRIDGLSFVSLTSYIIFSFFI